MNITLLRDIEQLYPYATFGTLSAGTATLRTLELPWVPLLGAPIGWSTPDVSCVPKGLYHLELHDSLHHPKTFALVNKDLGISHMGSEDINARSQILIHIANFVSELNGCIGLGTGVGFFDEEGYGITHSADAFALFRSNVQWIEGHTLEIV